MRLFHRFWPLWVGVVGIALNAWFYMQWRAIYVQAEPALKAGWMIDVHLSVFSRVIGLTGLLLIAFAILVYGIRCLRALIGSLREARNPITKR